ncbi:MAG: cobalamin biosynthesis protein CobW [Cytophagales bacterium]|nr:cobalamin biosynthesis protein CobW [Cytophagales bacterium]
MKKIPITIITGFLGSGKTTLIRELIKQVQDRKMAFLINEFGEMDVDGQLLKNTECGCDEEDIISLSNGCVCCTVQEDFLPTMNKLLARDENWDHILIETSGLALPEPLLRAIHWPSLRGKLTIDAVITVVDLPRQQDGSLCERDKVEAQRQADDSLNHETTLEDLFKDQLKCADLIVLSKSDLLSPEDIEVVKKQLRRQMPQEVPCLMAQKGKLPIQVLLGQEKQSEEKVNHLVDPDNPENPHTHDDHTHDESLSSCLLQIDHPHDHKQLIKALKKLLSKWTIYRIKGFVHINHKPMRMVLQAVGKRFDCYFDRPWKKDEPKATRLVFIGEHLSAETLKQDLHEELLREIVGS